MVEWSEGRAPLADILATGLTGYPRLIDEDEAGTLPWLAGIAHAMRDVSEGHVVDIDHICGASGVSAVSEVTALPLSPPARRIIAENPDLVCRFAGDGCELVFATPPDASRAIEYPSPGLALPISSVGAIETRMGVRLVDAVPKRVPVTASGWQHFRC